MKITIDTNDLVRELQSRRYHILVSVRPLAPARDAYSMTVWGILNALILNGLTLEEFERIEAAVRLPKPGVREI